MAATTEQPGLNHLRAPRAHTAGPARAVAGLAGARRLKAACEVVASARPTHVRPDWGIESVVVDGRLSDVDVQPVVTTPFATLRHFDEPAVSGQPRALLAGPISGHFATLLRPTVRTLLADHDVYVLDWHNARESRLDEAHSASTSTSTTSCRRCGTWVPAATF